VNPNINPANAVTASRYLTIPPFVYCLANGYYQWATFLAIVCGLLDKLDGLVAKTFDCKTDFGSIFDAITDAVCYGAMIVALAYYEWVPLIPVILLIALGTLNTLFRGMYARRAGGMVNYRSYAMERVVAYFAYLVGFGTCHFEVVFFYWGAVAITGITVLHDTKRMLLDPVPA
jgi:phosphatidylglycerophosphate synthase